MPTLSKTFNKWKIAIAHWLAAAILIALFSSISSVVTNILILNNSKTITKQIIIGNSTSQSETINIVDETGNYTIIAYNATLNKTCSTVLITNGTFDQAINGTSGSNTKATIINSCFKINYVGTTAIDENLAIIIYTTGFKINRQGDAAVFSWTFKDGSKIDKIVVTKQVKETVGNSIDFSFIVNIIGIIFSYSLVIKGAREVGIII